MMTAEQLAEHIERLCADGGVELDVRTATNARSWRRPRRIRITRVKSIRTYYVAMHELGHVLARRRSLGPRLEKEATAWMWALEHALVDPNEAVWGLIHRSLDSYLTWAETRQYREHARPVLPVEGDLFSRLHRAAGVSVIRFTYDAVSADPTPQEPTVPETVVQSPKWRARYVHPDKPKVEVRVSSVDKPKARKLFNVAGEPALLVAQDIERITNDSTTTPRSTTKMATKTRPKRKTTPAEAEPDDLDGLDVDDLDGLDELDVDDLGDLDLDDDDLVDDEAEEPEAEADEPEEDEEPEPDEGDDLDGMDRTELKRVIRDEELGDLKSLGIYKSTTDDEIRDKIRDARGTEEPEEDEPEDELGDLDLDDEEEAPKAGKPKAPPKAKASSTSGDKPLSDAQSKMLKDAYRLKNGAPVDNIGKQRTADALIKRRLVKHVPNTDKGYVEATVAGAKALGKEKREPATAKAAPKSEPAKGKSNGAPRALPKGMYGVAQIAKATDVHEETVRRVLRLNEDRFTQTDGRWAFGKDEAKEVIREVKSYVKYTGGKRGRPKGATTELPDGKVGASYIAEQAGVHKNTVYNFLRKHADKLAKFKDENGTYLFTPAQADKLVAKLKK